MRRAAFVSLAVVVALTPGCAEPNTTDYDPVGLAAGAANMELTPSEQITSCVDSTKFGAFMGDATARTRWESAGRSETELSDLCREIGRTDPAALAAIHDDWTSVRAAIAAAEEAPVTD